MNFQCKRSSSYTLGQIMGARCMQPGFYVSGFKMADEDSHSTESSVSGDEGYSGLLSPKGWDF